MKLLKNIVCTASVLLGISAFAQQDPNRTFYRYNMNLINPAFAGSHSGSEGRLVSNGSELGINFRSQWSGVAGAPETQSVFFSTGLAKNVGLGLNIINDRTFIEQQTAIGVDVSYRVKVSNRTNLFFGVKAGATSYNANTDGLTTFGISEDPSLINIEGGFRPAIGAGILFKGEEFFLALSAPNLTTTERLEQESEEIRLGDSRTHMYFSGGYDINLSRNIIFKPSFITRYIDAAPLSIDLTAAFRFNERLELGASYRLNEGIGGLLLFNAAKWLDFGYAYEAPFASEIVASDNGTHELFIRFKSK